MLGIPFGLQGILVPNEPTAEEGFAIFLLESPENITLLGLLGIVAIAGSAIVFRSRVLAAMSAALAGCEAWRFALVGFNVPPDTDLLALGYQATQRAHAFPYLLGAFALLVISRVSLSQSIAKHTWQQWPLIVPIRLVFVLHLEELREWRSFVASFCTELDEPDGQNDSEFLALSDVRRFGWNRELPTLSVLLRSRDSDHMITDPSYHGWLPFEPANAVPNITKFKKSASVCRTDWAGE